MSITEFLELGDPTSLGGTANDISHNELLLLTGTFFGLYSTLSSSSEGAEQARVKRRGEGYDDDDDDDDADDDNEVDA